MYIIYTKCNLNKYDKWNQDKRQYLYTAGKNMNKKDHLFDKYKKLSPGKKSLWKILAGMMAVIVTFVTTYSLILPAITVSVDQYEEVPGLYLDEEDYGYEIVEDKEEMPESSLTTVGESVVDTGMEGIWDEEFIEDEDPLTETESELEEAGINPAPETGVEPETQVETKIAAEVETEIESESATEIAAEAETEVESESETKIAADTETADKSETGAESEIEFAAETETEFATEAEVETEAETEVQPLSPAQVFYDRVEGIRVIVNASEGAFPEGTTMTVNRVEDEEILQGIEEAAATDNSRVSRVEAVDICFLGKDGEEIEPQQPISVRLVTEMSKPEEEAIVVHMDDNGQTETFDDASVYAKGKSEEVVSFKADHFSVYAVVYTVDFEYFVNGKMYQFSLPGGEKIALSDLIEMLDIIDDANNGEKAAFDSVDGFLKEVANVEFSDESLVKVSQNEEGNDWTLESLAPFDTEESLTIAMKNGDVFTVKVTDAQIRTDVLTAGGETYTITVEYDDSAEIPDDATLSVTEILPDSEAYTEYYEKAYLALGNDAGAEDVLAQYARFFDIKILSGGKKIEPQADVSVSIVLKDTAETEAVEWKLVHFKNELPDVLAMEETEDETTGETTVDFLTDSFSVYGVITVPAPSSVNDLNGYSVRISNLGYYLGAENITVGDSRRLSKTNNEADAPVWTFESAGTSGQYYISTTTDEGKQYINIKKSTEERGDVILSGEAQALTVEQNGSNYRIRGTDNGSTYYLNQYDNTTGVGFAGWWYNGSAEAQLDFTFVPPIAATNGKEYMVVVKQGDAYYVVLNDGTLSSAQYNEEDNTVAVDDPMMWNYDGSRLYHVTREAGFNGDDIPSDSYYRYIDPNSSSGWSEDDETNTSATGDLVNRRDVHITSRNLWDVVKISYTDHKLQSVSNPGYYIGIEQGRLKGQVSAEDAVEVFLADSVVQGSDWTHHSVGHIDISINGTAEADVPLAFGKYYDENGNVVKEVAQNQFEKLRLTRDQVVNDDDLAISPADMMRSRITAVCNGETLDNAFYITGYSGNAEHGGQAGGETDYLTSPQVRIEGSFLVAQMPQNHATIDIGLYDTNSDYRNDIRAEHLANQVEYNVSVTKSVEFYLQMPVLDSNGEQLTDENDNPIYQQLYDADGTALKIKVDLSFSDSFTYWDVENECPVFTDTDRWYYYKNNKPDVVNGWNEDNWEEGDVARCGFSGMDFKLGGSGSLPNTRVYAIEITKIVVDEQGNRIKSDNVGTTKFSIYRKLVDTIPSARDLSGNEYLDVVSAADDEVKDLNIGSFSSDEAYAEGYSFLRDKIIQVGNDGFGLVYDYDVTPALYYIEEDPDSVTESITDTTGKQWDYKQTYIWTEYAWRNCAHDNFMHVGQTYTEKPEEGGYKGVPEILGNHYGYNGTDGPYTNDFLEFYVYNVYESPKVDVPVIKLWPAFDTNGDGAADPDDQYGWEASFKLQWAPLYPGENAPNTNFRDVTPVQPVTVTEENMAVLSAFAAAKNMTVVELVQRYLDGSAEPVLSTDEISAIEAITFKDLPKYGTDTSGNTYRIQYSLEETGYRVIKRDTGVVMYSWSETEGYNDPEESTHFQPFYPHDAGENESGHTNEQNEADANYYIQVRNAPKNIRENEFIDVDVTKQWDSSFGERQDGWYAEFELKRFVHTEHRDLSHMTDYDRAADPITLTVKNADNETLNTFKALPNLGLFLGANFKPHTEAKIVTFRAEPAVTLVNGARVSTITVTAEGSNASNALVRSQEFFVTQDTVFTLAEGAENLIDGSNSARVLDTSAGSPPLPDRAFSQTIRLDNSNGWTTHLKDLIRSETHSGDNDDQENVVYYEYYLVEKESNPDGYAQYFRAGLDGNPTSILSGDSDHQIETDDSIIALNGPSNRLIVKKLWRGVLDTTGFPGITFTLYQTTDRNGNGAQPYVDENGTVYKNIELKGHNLEWICPVELPKTVTDSNGISHDYYYFVQEDDLSGNAESGEGDNKITTSWAFYYYRSAFQNDNGQETARQTNAGSQGYQAYLLGSEIAGYGGTITICNKMNEYINMDIKKKFFELQNAGSWATVTQEMDRWKGTILGFKVIRAVKAPDGKWLDESGNESDNPVWMDYSEEMRCGYDNNGNPIVDRGPDDVFYLKNAGGNWHFEIMNNWGDQTNINAADSGSGLPSYGFYVRNGEDLPVEYWYSFRETNVYKLESQDPDGTIHVTDYPEWDWYSTITPEYAYGPALSSGGDAQTMIAFPHNVPSQESDRISNFQASDLIINKEWLGENTPDAKAVYLKVWRQAEGGQIEDFTAIIADDIRNNQGWQNYVNTPDIIDLNRNCLVLNRDGDEWSEASLKINRALLGTINGQNDHSELYHYYIQEIGYRTNSGEYRTDVNGRFKPLYNKWDPSREQWADAPVGMNDYANNNITIGAKGENRLKVINSTSPSTSYTVTKAFHGPQSSTGGQSSVTGKYPTDGSKQVVVMLQQRYRYEKIVNGVKFVLKKNGNYNTGEDWLEDTEQNAEAIAEAWLVDWQAAESASPVSVALPLDKPAGSVLSDEAWYDSAAAWTYTWEGLDVTKTLAEEADPANSRIAQLYYRAVEVSTPDWFNSVIAAEEQNGHMAVDDGSQTAAGVLSEKNTVTNERNDINLNLNKVWTGLGDGKTWPDNVTIDYQLVQHFHLALADMSTTDEDGLIAPVYSTGKIFKSVDMTTTSSGASTADSVHPQAIGRNVGKPSDGSTVIARITGLPVYGFLTATAEDVAEAAEAGVVLTEGTVYPVVYTYSAKETAVKKNGSPIAFREQTVDAELDDTASSPVTYKATLTNELVSVTVEKVWNGFTPTTNESARIQLRRFKKDIEPEPETTFTYTVSVTGSEDALNSDGTVTAVIYDEENEEAGRYVLKKNDWSHEFELENGGTYYAAFETDGTILETVTPLAVSDITETGSIVLTATVKPAASGSVKVVVTGSPSGLWMTPLQDSNGTELNPQKSWNPNYFDNSSGETGVLDGLMPGTRYRFQIGSAPTSVEGATYNNQFVSFTATDGLTTITLNYSSGGGEGYNTTSGSFSGGDSYWGIDNWSSLTVGTIYTFTFQVSSDPNDYSVEATGVTSCSYEVINNWTSGGQITVTFVPASKDENVVITASRTVGNRALSARSVAAPKALKAPQLRAPATITWTNDITGLPEGAVPADDELVDTVTFFGSTWSKTWNELPKYSDDGMEYVYYAYETDYSGLSGATELVTTYSIEDDGTIKVTNTPTIPNLGNLKVTKKVFYGADLVSDPAFNDKTFTVGIFSDAEGTTRVAGQEVQTITLNEGSGEATFTGLPGGTYYVYEIVNGNPVLPGGTTATIDDVTYTVTYENNAAQVSNGATAEAVVKNTLAPYELNIIKVDADDMETPLPGAKFVLQKIDGDKTVVSAIGDPVDPETSGTDHKTGSNGSAAFANLAMGYYEITEIELPDGYVLTNSDGKFYIKVTASGISVIAKKEDTAVKDWPSAEQEDGATFTFNAATATATVGNTPGAALPNTGGPGTRLFTILGNILLLLSGTLLWRRRRWV